MSNRPWQGYLDDILDAAEAISSYTAGISFTSFCNERMRQSAVIREFLIIGKAIGKLPDTIKAQEQQIPWQDIRDFRNLLWSMNILALTWRSSGLLFRRTCHHLLRC